MPEDCSAVKDFICEQTRCYYYNYGSIPVSSAQGRPITTTTPRTNIADSVQSETKINTTPLPLLMSSYAASKMSNQPSYVSLKLDQERALESSLEKDNSHPEQQQSASYEHEHDDTEETEHDGEVVDEEETEDGSNSAGADESAQGRDLANEEADHELEEVSGQQSQESSGEQHDDDHEDSHDQELEEDKSEAQHDDSSDKHPLSHEQEEEAAAIINSVASKEKSGELYETESHDNEMPGVEVRLKQISQEVEKRASEENRHIPSLTPDLDDIGHQSFLSLTDLIRTLRPNDKQIIPQIDSDYSNAMRVLGEKSVVVSNSNGNNNE
uniref:Uncharacterized protein n=1 Tax=Musca domestica TaxID=7370 RepID=A0A1I8MPE0_MUSDO